MSFSASIVICSHNPRLVYLERVLQALRFQTLSLELWEIILIDNASDTKVCLEIDISWHPNSIYLREDELGLTSARLRGIQEAKSDLLIFVDDDNVLNFNYLERAIQIGKNFPQLGVWGGQIFPKFDKSPPEWTKPYWHMLALYKFSEDCWSNILYAGTNPCGAGMCVRRIVADKYMHLVQNDSNRKRMDRKGNSLMSCGDTDLAFTACDVGLGMGKFVSLLLTHLIPEERLKEEYLLNLAQANGYSSTILRSFRDKLFYSSKKIPLRKKLYQYYCYRRKPSRERKFHKAYSFGESLAVKELRSMQI